MAERLPHYLYADAEVDLVAETTTALREFMLDETPTTALGTLLQRRQDEIDRDKTFGIPTREPVRTWLEGETVEAITGLSGNQHVPNVQRVLDVLVEHDLAVSFPVNTHGVQLKKYAGATTQAVKAQLVNFEPEYVRG